eukprot:CAMPEP_0202483426 /NCGR_PEP_ID=MMETSP1361-20130828/2675_1 /ASSEMBLY_ACC=CAM_ASM_000849 /TAXON_ID=210615 /ORGANISM="Staurosira complex sp., Strain CCMP2646" /LENGTH=354 /DNA_ID=CAMNT_0049111683 /DNA_START=50 /DNA_END=1114 /DNA_ORIENTATION=+
MASPPDKPDGGRRRMSIKVVDPETEKEKEAKTKKIKWILWRDVAFLVAAAVAAHYMGYVELHASEAELRGGVSNDNGIVDTGFIVTTPIHDFLRKNRGWNDALAAINSLALFIPGIYAAYVTLWKGDYDLAFRYFAMHILRSFCGWFTYLPPDPSYLPSNYDVPDIMQCLFAKDCRQAAEPEVLPFVSFFSGHVCTMVTTANHMYLRGYRNLGLFCHVLNVLQMVRLLATRGHYSIDMIIAWYMAKYVSNTAGRLGRYYSRGVPLSDIMPRSGTEAFETITGVYDVKKEARISRLMKKHDLQKALLEMEEEDVDIVIESESETTATMLVEGMYTGASDYLLKKNSSGYDVKKVS